MLTLIFLIKGVREVTQQQFPHRPNPQFTTGDARLLSVEQVCEGVAPLEILEVNRKWVFDHYGIDRPTPETYELDLLIPASLGGTTETANLWPQPRIRVDWTASAKNALEERLRERVCSGEILLEEAQKALSKDWIAAYQETFHARLPLTIHRQP